MNYDELYRSNPDVKFHYNGDKEPKLMVGRVSLENAINRLKFQEYYLLVTYNDFQELPKEYVPLNPNLTNGSLLATLSPEVQIHNIVTGNKIQIVTRLNSNEYLLGPGPETFDVKEALRDQIDQYNIELDEEEKEESSFMSM